MKCFAMFAATLAVLASSAFAADAKVETVVGGFDNPCGIAVQPETGHVFVSDSGAGRIVRVVGNKLEEVVVGFPLDVYGKGPMYNVGPMGLAFLDKDTLIVGDGGFKDGEEFIRVFAVPAAGGAPIKFEDTKAKLGPLAATGDLKPEGNLYALALTKNALFVTCNGDDTKGWVAKAEINGAKFGELKRFIATKEAVEVDAPVGITISGKGEVVIGQMGEINVPNDSLLSIYNANTGKLLLNQKTGLFDITALAYGPKSSQLYALDFAWMKPEEGGLFQLVSTKATNGTTAVTTKKIASLDKPTAMAFGKDGELYITVIGPKKEDNVKSGQLLKIAPGL